MEKQSKYVTQYTDYTRPKHSSFARRQILLSLPRVQWLDRQPDYEPWPPVPEMPVQLPAPSSASRPRPRPTTPTRPTDELSAREQKALELSAGGMLVKDIAVIIGCSRNAASKVLNRARQKKGIGLG
jgi:DNA-binding CsgD family transcriptional regulator